jgi:hypothetical protein
MRSSPSLLCAFATNDSALAAIPHPRPNANCGVAIQMCLHMLTPFTNRQ